LKSLNKVSKKKFKIKIKIKTFKKKNISLPRGKNQENLKKHWNHKRVNKLERVKFLTTNLMSKTMNQKKFKKIVHKS